MKSDNSPSRAIFFTLVDFIIYTLFFPCSHEVQGLCFSSDVIIFLFLSRPKGETKEEKRRKKKRKEGKRKEVKKSRNLFSLSIFPTSNYFQNWPTL